MGQYYRHGDLLIQSIEEIPSGLQEKKDLVLLEGETTGHMHTLNKGIVYLPVEAPSLNNDFLAGFIELKEDATLTHQEHEAIVLAPGKYKFYQQREYDEQEDRAVVD